MADIYEGMERDERAMERIATALESIADSLAERCKIESARLDKEYPPKHEPRESTVTKLPTAEDKLRASQGATGEPIADWMRLDIGPREREVLAAEAANKTPKKRSS